MKRNKKTMYSNLGLISQLGLNIIIPILGGLYLGIKLDEKFNKSMLFSIIFLVLGSITGFLNLMKLAKRAERKSKNKDSRNGEE